MTRGTILIISNDRDELGKLEKIARQEFDNVITLTSPSRMKEVAGSHNVDIVVLDSDYRSPVRNGNEGLYLMREIHGIDSDICIVVVTDPGEAGIAVNAVREGAAEIVFRPLDEARVLAALNVAWNLRQSRLETLSLRKDNRKLKDTINSAGERIVGVASPTMIRVMDIVRKVAATEASVLITGENGTGKELIAREIHRLSPRSGELMVTVDMGSVTETLFESELFGHVRGAFTDAREDRKGKIEAADQSTLFLDEIGNLSLQSQAKLLRVLQNRNIVRVGSNKPVPVNIRLICATNRDILQMVREAAFREDLLYRINTIMIEVPPLRDRVDDIPVLAGHFLKTMSEKYGREGMKISVPALEKLADHEWPGNVRELQHTIEKAVIMSDSDTLKPADFIFNQGVARSFSSEMTLEQMERKMIADAMRRHGNNMSTVSRKLGITRQTLYNKISRYRI